MTHYSVAVNVGERQAFACGKRALGYGAIAYLNRSVPQSIPPLCLDLCEIEISTASQYLPRVLLLPQNHITFQCSQLVDVVAVDIPRHKLRFSLPYLLLSVDGNARIRVRAYTAELRPVYSVTSLYPCALWLEREVWDMFGVCFSGHPDLRRLSTDYGHNGFPPRKDFPLTGFTEVVYDDDKRVPTARPVSLAQEYRYYSFDNPWAIR